MARRLIDADKLKQHYAWWGSVDNYTSDTMTYPEAKAIVDTIIDLQPTIEAEPNSCEYWDSESHFCALRRPQAEPNSDIKWQGRYCIECLYSSTCYGAGIDKPACKSFVPRVGYVDCNRMDSDEWEEPDKEGQWKYDEDKGGWYCTRCDRAIGISEPLKPYCGWCGAKMKSWGNHGKEGEDDGWYNE